MIRIIDGPIAPTPCVSLNFYIRCDDCADEDTCAIRPITLRVRDANPGVYERTTLRMLAGKVVRSYTPGLLLKQTTYSYGANHLPLYERLTSP